MPVYYLIDDYSTAGGAGGTGAPLGPEFTAPSLAAAEVVALIVATAYQRPVRVVPKGGEPPYVLVAPGLTGVGLTSVPSGIGY